MATKSYRIVGKTNGWIAQRDVNFNGKTEVIFEKHMTLKEARKKLLEWFNNDYDLCCPNWGSAMNSKEGRDNASRYDGLYSYWWDSRSYSIEEEESTNYNYIVELNGAVVETGEVTIYYEEEEAEFIEKMTDKYAEDCDDEVEVLFR